MTASPHHEYTVEDYVRVERGSLTKHEFLNGEIYAMAGGTPELACTVDVDALHAAAEEPKAE